MTEYGDLTWLHAISLDDPKINYQRLLCIWGRKDELLPELCKRASTYAKNGQLKESIFVREQIHSIQTTTFRKHRDPSIYTFDFSDVSSEKLAELHQRNGNQFQAEYVLSECLVHEDHIERSVDDLNHNRFERLIHKLVKIYGLFQQRTSTMGFGSADEVKDWRRLAVSTSIMDRAARTDTIELTTRLYHSGLIDPDTFSTQALFVAASRDACNLARFALDQGTDIEAKNYYGNTALHEAIWFQSINMVNLLVSRGALIEARNEALRTPLHKAAACKSLDIVNSLLVGGANIEARDGDHTTVLSYASRCGNLVTVRHLLEKGAKINAANITGFTALHYAAERGRVDVLDYLLRWHANIEVRDSRDNTALHVVAGTQFSNLDSTRPYLNKDLLGCMDSLIDGGLSVESGRKSNLETPLHCACRAHNQKFVEYLLQKDASALAVAVRGSPLHYVFECSLGEEHQVFEVVRTLLEFGALVNNARLSDGKTPVHLGAQLAKASEDYYAMKILELLLRFGGNQHLWDDSSMSALDYARGCEPAWELLNDRAAL